ncbi:Aminotransferase [Ruminococcaceae bacterium BL-4]|nr:Aminotransferase [Ruminococcaceae bacterium BL-4]
MQAIILAAGMGKRLKELTQNNTKCMVKVNGITLIERALTQLDQLSLNRIVIVEGYEGKKLIDFINTLPVKTPITFVDNPIYDKTNNIYSLWLAKDYLLEDDTLLLESDIIFEDSVLHALTDDPRDTLALVDRYESWMDGTVMQIDKNDRILSFVPGKDFDFKNVDSYYKTVNLYKFGKEFSRTHYVPFLEAYSKALGNNEYYEQVLRVIAMLDNPGIYAKRLNGERWYEIDDIQDLDIASSLFSSSDEALLSSVESRYGGYWRYPKLLDFCYLVNPYFPPQKMINEMQSNFVSLLTQYPSGMKVNSLLAARNFNLHSDEILVGNGAAELIKSFMSFQNGKVGVIRPTFEEYPNRYSPEKEVIFRPDNADFSYTADDLMNFFSDKGISTLILINPDNPSGNLIPKKDLLRLLAWCNEKSICLLLDESFADFSEQDASLLKQFLISANPNLSVMKSISKSYGVPGIRLGVFASGNKNLIASMKKDVAIWNINSFGEFFMQIEEKYKKDYAASLLKIKKARKEFISQLSSLPGLRIIPSEANYVMAEIVSQKWTAFSLTKELLCKDHILIKDLTKKVGKQYVRIAVRDEKDNQKLINCLKKLF